MIVGFGMSVIVDATFLHGGGRRAFASFFQDKNISFLMLALNVESDELRRRVLRRTERGDDISDADLEVLERQLGSAEPIAESEECYTLYIDANNEIDIEKTVLYCQNYLKTSIE
jgi:hypothetical protein